MPTETFQYTGDVQQWTVPDGVEEVHATLIGAGGADGEDGDVGSGRSGGPGGRTEALLDVSGSQSLSLWVAGTSWGRSSGGAGGTAGSSNAGDGGDGAGSTEIWDDASTFFAAADGGGGGGGGSASNWHGAGGGGGGRGGAGGDDGGGDTDYAGEDGEGTGNGGAGGDGAALNEDNATAGSPGGGELNDQLVLSEAGITTGGGNAGDGEIILEYSEPLPEPENVSVDDEREAELDLSWDPVTDADEYYVYRDGEPGPYDNGSVVATVPDDGSSTISYTDTALTNGRQYHYQITADSDSEEYIEGNPSDEITGTTLLSPPVLESATSLDDATIALEFGRDDNNPDGDLSVYRSKSNGTLGSSITAVEPDTTSHTDSGLEERTVYYYTIRRDTGDATADSLQKAEITDLTSPSITSVARVGETRLRVEWQPPDPAEEQRVYASTDGGDTFDVDTRAIGGSATEITTGDLAPNQKNRSDIHVYVEAEDHHEFDGGQLTTSGTESGDVATITEFEDAWSVVLRLDGQLEEIPPDQWISVPSWRSEPSAIVSWMAEIPWSLALEDWQQAEAFIYFDGSLMLRGEFHNPTSQNSTGTTQLNGEDVVKKLDRGGESVTFESIEAHKAIREYAEQYLDEWEVTIHEPEPDPIDEGLVVQEGDLEEIFDPAETDPFRVDAGLPHLQSAHHADGFADLAGSTTNDQEGADYSGPGISDGTGVAIALSDSGDQGEWEFDIPYTMPEEAVGVWIRFENDGATPGTVFELDGNEIASLSQSAGEALGALTWRDFANADNPYSSGWTNGDLDAAETHTVTVRVNDGANGDSVVDRVALIDNRFDYTFDNDPVWTGEENALDGPELYPVASIESVPFDQTFNVAAAKLTTTIDDVSGDQRLEVSNDGGDTWLPSDGTEQNTALVDVTFDETFGTTIRGRWTASGYPLDEPRDVTPRYGYEGQTLTSWELAIDTDDLAVIDEEEVVGSHLENLQRLHNRAGMVFVPEYDAESLRLDSLVAGDVEREAEWTRLDYTRDPDTSDYANAVTVFGALDDEETGERLVAEARSQAEIEEKGEIPAPPIFEDDVENEEQLRNIARTELGNLLAEGRMAGTVEIAPKPLRPGFGYEVPALDGEVLPLWGTEFDDARGGQGSLEFGEPDDLASAITSIRVDVREQKG